MIRALIVAAFLTLGLGGCQTTGTGVDFNQTYTNPVGRNQLAAIESSYGLALTLAVNYRRLGLCPKASAGNLNGICARRDVVLKLQAADRKVRVAILAARKFVKNNPTISPASAIAAVQTAVNDFRDTLAQNGVN